MNKRHEIKEDHGAYVLTWCGEKYPVHGTELEGPEDKIHPLETCEECKANKEKNGND